MQILWLDNGISLVRMQATFSKWMQRNEAWQDSCSNTLAPMRVEWFSLLEKSYQHFVNEINNALQNDGVKILWYFSIQTGQKIEHTDLNCYWQKWKAMLYSRHCACQFDAQIRKKVKENFNACTDIKYEVLKVWRGDVKNVVILPVIICALGLITGRLQGELEKQ